MVTHATGDGAAPSILIVDDDLDTALFVKMILRYRCADIAAARPAGALAYLVKPVGIAALARAIRRAFGAPALGLTGRASRPRRLAPRRTSRRRPCTQIGGERRAPGVGRSRPHT